MRQKIMAIFSLCMVAALCSRIMDRNRFFNALRLVLGLEIVRTLLSLIGKFA